MRLEGFERDRQLNILCVVNEIWLFFIAFHTIVACNIFDCEYVHVTETAARVSLENLNYVLRHNWTDMLLSNQDVQ
jgi:hypothetical protein